MNKIYFFFFYGLFFLVIGTSKVSAQQVFKTTSSSVIAYLEYLPEDYAENSDKYPIVFFFHGIGERGPNTTDPAILGQYIQNVAKHGPPQLVKNGTQFPFILISPQLKNNYSSWTTTYIMEVINHCKTYLRIDEKRIYMTGLSLGGGGTWVAAQDKPELFAAIAPVCGGYNSPTKACYIASENLPVWAFHGDADATVSYLKSVNMVNAINNCMPTPSPRALMTIYPGVGHNAWDYAYLNDHTLHNPNVYEWLLSYSNTKNHGNQIPTANAGADKTVTIGSATISGSGTDADGTMASYEWTKISGPAVTMPDLTSSTLSLSNVLEGTYVFRLKVTDNSGNTDSDYVKLTGVVQANISPVATAGDDKVITMPVNTAIISGSANDSDGTISSYAWTKISGGTATIANASSASPTVSNLAEGSYTFRLTVTDNKGATGSDDVQVVVNPPVVPVVNAGLDKIVTLPSSSVAITGTASDQGGSIVSYTWTKISGGTCTLSGTTSASLKISGLTKSDAFVFRLTATDNDGYSSYDEVKVVVNVKPVSDAGADKSVMLPMSAPIYLNGSGTDADGTITGYLWSKYSGPNVLVENSKTASLKINKLYEGTYVFKLQVTDNNGVKAFDYVTITVGSGTSSRMSSESVEETTSALADVQFDIENLKGMNEGLEVAVYNVSGEKLYQGPWSEEKDAQVIQQGLYIYRVMRQGAVVHSGKILRTQ
jgi:dienelactone hydrolase